MNSRVSLFEKLDFLIDLLSCRQSPSAVFFVVSREKLISNNCNSDTLDSLIKSYAITQYANFSKKEEDLLNEIIDIARNIKV